MPMMRGAHAGGGRGQHAGARRQAVRFAAASDASIRARRAVVDAGGIAGGHGAVGTDHRLQLASVSSVVSGRGCSSARTIIGSPFFWGMATGTISSAKKPSAWAAAARCWLRRAKCVLILAGDVELLGYVLRGFRHGVDAVRGLHRGIDEAPADGGVVDLGAAARRPRRPCP